MRLLSLQDFSHRHQPPQNACLSFKESVLFLVKLVGRNSGFTISFLIHKFSFFFLLFQFLVLSPELFTYNPSSVTTKLYSSHLLNTWNDSFIFNHMYMFVGISMCKCRYLWISEEARGYLQFGDTGGWESLCLGCWDLNSSIL